MRRQPAASRGFIARLARAARRVGARGAGDEGGFTIVETAVALGVIFTVVLGLMGSLNTGVRGLITGRQRTGAVALAKEVIEQARSHPYDEIGHDVVNDATLGTDPAVGGTAPDYTYTPDGGSGPEPLVASTAAYFPEHEWSETRDAGTMTVRVYVTWVEALVGDDHKRLTVEVEYGPDLYGGSTVENVVRLSSFISVGGQSAVTPGTPFPTAEVSGLAEAGAGFTALSGVLGGVTVDDATVFNPVVYGDVEGQIIRNTHGTSTGTHSTLTLGSGTLSAAQQSGGTGTCEGPSAATVADNDGGTAPAVHDADGPESGAACTMTGSSGGVTAFSMSHGSGSVAESATSAESCTTCSPAVGDGDDLMYGVHEATPADSGSIGFEAGVLRGSLAGWAATSDGNVATIDVDPVASDKRVTSTGRIRMPAVDLLTLDAGGPVGFSGAVRISAVDVTATAQAGPTASAPSVSGNPVTIQVYETDLLGTGAYTGVTITPGQAYSRTFRASFGVSLPLLPVAQVTIETTVTASAASTSCSPDCTSIEEASALVDDWLVVTSHFTAVQGGITTADITTDLNYGRLSAQARYVP
ncbi:MAG TPA: hypothetical protein VM618_11140 [Acidimicrobiia bacterium]|nr:hypothetical protein [Acidimicrobiia bacterium]